MLFCNLLAFIVSEYVYFEQTNVAAASTHCLLLWCSDQAHTTFTRPSLSTDCYGRHLNVLAPPTEHAMLSVSLT